MPLSTLLLALVAPLLTHLRNFLLYVLASGPIPSHIAFVMDGNRRYARLQHKAVQQGHIQGYQTLRHILELCLRLGVKCVSVYAFSIENFKRSKEEVDALMGLAEEKLEELCRHGDLLDEYGVRLNVIGKTKLLPESVQRAVQKAESMTRHNDRAILNLCMPYTSRDEITTAVQSTIHEKLLQSPSSECTPTVTEHDIASHLMITRAGSPPLDVLVRTSDVKRLSDFMLWQASPIHSPKLHSPFLRGAMDYSFALPPGSLLSYILGIPIVGISCLSRHAIPHDHFILFHFILYFSPTLVPVQRGQHVSDSISISF
ncbi:hypothetical protein AX15_001428 [Amanita polypyramis BW_CC]|nr:hypothetical protein AX15_001428 [Amanita polypyramis BW_CC]